MSRIAYSGVFNMSATVIIVLLLGACTKDSPPPVYPALSGTISMPEGTGVDSDVNDPGANYTSNNSIANAQAILNPVTLGGYVNQPGTGPDDGRSFSSGDVHDYYSVNLATDQTVLLNIGNSSATLSVTLEDLAGNIVQSAASVGDSIGLTVATGGNYLLHVESISGATNYVLTLGIGSGSVCDGTSGLNVNSEFVPGEIIVRFSDNGLASAQIGLQARAQSLGLSAKSGSGRDMLLSLGDETQTLKALATLGISRQRTIDSDREKQRKLDTIAVVNALRGRSDVISARPNYILKALLAPTDPAYNQQWNYPLINMEAAWDVTAGTSDVIVAVIDTGVLLNHPDLQGQLVQGYDFISDADRALDGDGRDSNPDDPGDGGLTGQSSFHGTHVAGTIAAAANNDEGGVGIGWNIRIMPLRVLGAEGGGTVYDIEQAVLYAAGLPNVAETAAETTARVSNGLVADVINLSLGGPTSDTSAPQAYVDARNAGVIIVAAAGNDASSGCSAPAALDGVVSVSAVDRNKALAWYSNYGDTIDVTAPGGDIRADEVNGIYSTVGTKSLTNGAITFGYDFYQGTSMAAPHVAGIAALMKSVMPNMSPGDFDAFLVSGSITEDLGTPERDNSFGYGLIDAAAAVNAANDVAIGNSAVPTVAARAVVIPSVLNFAYTTDSLNFRIRNEGNVPFATISSNVTYHGATTGWLTVAPVVNGAGTYTATVDRTVLNGSPDNVHSARIVISYDADTVEVPVLVARSRQGIHDDAGLHYVLLLDLNEDGFVDNTQERAVTAANGAYTFQFSNVAPGPYYLFATTDNDNDYDFCNAGEACGIYADLSNLVQITVSEGQADVGNLNFLTRYNTWLSLLSLNPRSRIKGGLGRELSLNRKQ